MRTVIIGGGASGMMAAIAASEMGDKVTVIEKNNKTGKKLLATGNGKCNFSNASCQLSSYFCDDEDFIAQSFGEFSQGDTMEFFKRIGVYPRKLNDRIYPYSEQAICVADALFFTVKSCQVTCMLGAEVIDVVRGEKDFYIHIKETEIDGKPRPDQIRTIEADKLIIATGGKAGEQYGCTGDGYRFAQSFGHSLVKPLPALVQLTSDDECLKEMHGARAKGDVHLYIDRKKVMKSSGEIQFTRDGISGICVFDLSRMVSRAIDQNKRCELSVDLMPELKVSEVEDLIKDIAGSFPRKFSRDCLDGFVNRKLHDAILKKARFSRPRCYSSNMRVSDVESLAGTLKAMKFLITGTKGWRDAQTTTGGIPLDEVDARSMESRKVKGLHFCGEILDVDGICGGYNLQWAWTSGYLAGCRR